MAESQIDRVENGVTSFQPVLDRKYLLVNEPYRTILGSPDFAFIDQRGRKASLCL